MHDDSKCFIKVGSGLQVMIIGMLLNSKTRGVSHWGGDVQLLG